ncbi:hypothetical protein PS865_04429 [Pseudomonas fluorescens]|uniref:hypothetical protein n=1 Tax=Pseudomonas fluorescens TaxID=294 RepID=UPI001242953D|nr:hypothetical protein [Pseudomonas fluorescens]VVP32363.1 hypothetical protein PS865_04429 [Pseudomonas fluorescens]
MLSLADMRRLLRFGEHRQSQCEREIESARRAMAPLRAELRDLDGQEYYLRELLLAHQVNEQTFDHGQLLAFLRQQAVMRRQLGTIAIDRTRVEEQCDHYVQQIQHATTRRQVLERKQMMYLKLQQRLLRERNAMRSRLEEHEIEELLASHT